MNEPAEAKTQQSRLRRLVDRVRSWLRRPAARRLAAVGSVITVIAGLVGTVGNLERVPGYLCRVPGIHALCRHYEIGAVAGKKQEAAWRKAEKTGDAQALRAYLVAYPNGVYADDAKTRIAACRSVQKEIWTAEKRSLPLYVPSGSVVGASGRDAQAMALQRGEKDAANLCAGFTGEFRLRRASAIARQWQCREDKNGASCGFEGEAVCEVEARRLLSEETCH